MFKTAFLMKINMFQYFFYFVWVKCDMYYYIFCCFLKKIFVTSKFNTQFYSNISSRL